MVQVALSKIVQHKEQREERFSISLFSNNPLSLALTIRIKKTVINIIRQNYSLFLH